MKKLAILILVFMVCAPLLAAEKHPPKYKKHVWKMEHKKRLFGPKHGGHELSISNPKDNFRLPAHQRSTVPQTKHYQHWDLGMGM